MNLTIPEATIILQVYNDPERAKRLIREIRNAGDFHIVVVDDSDTSNDWSDLFPYIRLLRDAQVEGYGHLRLGYLMGRELGYRVALPGKPVITMDNDIVLPTTWWREFKAILEQDPKVGVIGPKFTGAKKTHDLQHVSSDSNLWAGRSPIDSPADYTDITRLPTSNNPAPIGTLDWNEFLTDIVLCWRKECLDQVRKMQVSFKGTWWLANAEYMGSPGLFHYPLGTYTAIVNGWKAVIANKVIVYHG